MFKSLSPGAIGIDLPLEQTVVLAASAGFEGIFVDITDAADRGVEGTRALLADRGLRPAVFGLPVEFRKDQATFREGIDRLDALAGIAARLGCFRCSTWVPSWHDELSFDQQFSLWLERFKRVAGILADHHIRLGLEFLGPATLRKGHKTEFIHTLPAMSDFCARIGTGNVGLLLDSWHWYTSGGTPADLAGLKNADVVDVHVNDAPAGVAVEDQIDQRRAIPLATGVIDLVGFLRALRDIGYDGPVTAEPFCAELNAMDAGRAMRIIAEALDEAFRQAGV